MTLNLFTTYDSKADAWTLPFFMSSTESIERAFSEVCNDPSSNYCKFPEDYTLFQIGFWDVKAGNLVIYESKKSIGIALKYKTTFSKQESI